MIDDSSEDNSCKTKQESTSQRMNEDDNKNKRNWEMILEQLSRDPDNIVEMRDDRKEEILEYLHKEADRIIEENKRGVGSMDQIKRYADGLSAEDRREFYSDINERFAQIIEEGLLRFHKLWKTKPQIIQEKKLQRQGPIH